MFALFFSLYMAMFMGTWNLYSLYGITQSIATPLKEVGTFATSIFGDFQVTDLGSTANVQDWLALTSFILALITSIGIVVMAVKGVKKAFGIFFGHIR